MQRQEDRHRVIMPRVLAGEPCYQVAQDEGITGARILHITTATFKRCYPQYRWRFELGLARMRDLAQTLSGAVSEQKE